MLEGEFGLSILLGIALAEVFLMPVVSTPLKRDAEFSRLLSDDILLVAVFRTVYKHSLSMKARFWLHGT